MPSDAAPAPRRLAWLRSQGLGVVCGQLTVLLLALGSIVLVATRDGASALVRFDDVTAFFARPSWAHAWLYALLAVLALYALNTALCTWDSLAAKLARRVREPSAYAPALMHVAFLLALVAHLVGGVWTSDRPPVVVAASWTGLGDGRQARVVSLVEEKLRDGRPKSADAVVEVKDAAGRVASHALGYNRPVSAGLGAELLLLEQAGRVPGAMVFSVGEKPCAARRDQPCVVGATHLTVVDVYESGPWGDLPAVTVEVRSPGASQRLVLGEGTVRALASGTTVRFAGRAYEPAVQVRGRSSPGNPWALLSALVMAAGLVLMGRRWL